MSEEFQFKKATKAAARLRLALCGPAGSGKTYTALTLAKHLGGRVAVIDTERGSASKYADLFDFDALELTPPFHPRRYVAALKAAEQAGFGTVIVDSLSHAWIGEGGGLELHDEAQARQKVKNSFTAWAEVTPHHNALVQALLQSGCNLIVTMRTKTDYVQEKDANGRTQVRKVGMAPLMRDGIEYEFDVTGDLDLDNVFAVGKTRCPALKGKVFKQPGKELADALAAWLGSGVAPAGERPAQGASGPSPAAPEKPAPAPAPEPSPVHILPKSSRLAKRHGGTAEPSTGQELAAKLRDNDALGTSEGRFGPGELIFTVTEKARRMGFPDDMLTWTGQQLRDGIALAREFWRDHPAPAKESAPA